MLNASTLLPPVDSVPLYRLFIGYMIAVTQAAVRQLQMLVSENPDYRDKGLRISIEDGGCAGRQYGMEFTASRAADHHVPLDGVEVIIDPDSARFLAGSTLDYTDGLTGSGFKILNPNAVRSCGCGTSFEFAEESR